MILLTEEVILPINKKSKCKQSCPTYELKERQLKNNFKPQLSDERSIEAQLVSLSSRSLESLKPCTLAYRSFAKVKCTTRNQKIERDMIVAD